MKNQKNETRMLLSEANEKERNIIVIGFFAIGILSYFLGKDVFGFRGFYIYLIFMLLPLYGLWLYVETRIRTRRREMESKKRAMNLYLGSYKKEKETELDPCDKEEKK